MLVALDLPWARTLSIVSMTSSAVGRLRGSHAVHVRYRAKILAWHSSGTLCRCHEPESCWRMSLTGPLTFYRAFQHKDKPELNGWKCDRDL